MAVDGPPWVVSDGTRIGVRADAALVLRETGDARIGDQKAQFLATLSGEFFVYAVR